MIRSANPAIARAMEAMHAAAPQAGADPARPVYHFCPVAGWMNDVNGPLYHRGYYHMFFQLNPFDTRMGDGIHWGHARSRDLVRWERLPIAIWPSTEKGETSCWSGTACLNGEGRPTIFYTRVGPDRDVDSFEQWAAMGDDDLVVWEKHPANPILALGTHGAPGFDRRWRDPFIFREQGRTFMVVGAAGPGTPLYEAQDEGLSRWAYRGLIAEISVECPNFFKVQDRWMLITSPYGPVEYWLGSFDLETLRFEPEVRGRMEETGRFYGTNVLFDDRGRCVFLGRLLDFGQGRGWNGCMALPRILSIGPDGRPRQVPAPELRKLRGERSGLPGLVLRDASHVVEGVRGDTLEVIAEFEPGDATALGLRVRRSADGRDAVEIRCDGRELSVAGCAFPLERTAAGGTFKLHVFLDRSVIEVFVDDGRSVATPIVFPGENDLGVEVFAEGGSATVRSLDAWEMNAIW